jgi:carbon monoxide dehydrogenase subunit G
MLKVQGAVCIDAPIEKVWAVLSHLESIQLWVPAIRHASCPGQSRGVGALRVCELKQATIHETIVAWEEGRSFTYRGEGAPMMKSALNTWTVTAHGGQTLVTSLAEVELKGGVFGRLLTPLVTLMSSRLGARSMASLKYLVEHGHPYDGGQPLLAGPASC